MSEIVIFIALALLVALGFLAPALLEQWWLKNHRLPDYMEEYRHRAIFDDDE